MKQFWGIAVIIIVGIILFKYTNVFKSASSGGNPNYPPSQEVPMIGPQGPNDGSNTSIGNGHTISPIFPNGTPVQPVYSRGFAYTGAAQYPGAVKVANVY